MSRYNNSIGGDIRKAWLDYYTFGGLPQVALLETEEKKTDYLRGLYETTYLRDVIERNHLRNSEGMKELVRMLASGIGSSTNPTRLLHAPIPSSLQDYADGCAQLRHADR